MNRIMALLVALCASAVSFFASAATYNASTGYVTMKAADSWKAAGTAYAATYDADGIIETSAGCIALHNWSDGQYVHANTNYYASAGIYALGRGSDAAAKAAKFPGNKFVLRDGTEFKYFGGGSSFLYFGDDTEFLPGSYLIWNSVGKVAGGTIKMSGTAEKPNMLKFNPRSDAVYSPSFQAKLTGDKTSVVNVLIGSGACSQRENVALNSDYSEFLGLMHVQPNPTSTMTGWLRFLINPAFNFAGTFELDGPHVLEFSGSSSSTPIFGSLKLGSGSKLTFSTVSSRAPITVTNQLVIASDAKISVPSFLSGNTWRTKGCAASTNVIFDLSAEAVKAGVPSIEGVLEETGAIGSAPMELKPIDLPDGGAQICSIRRAVVAFTNSETYGNTPFEWKAGMDETSKCNPVRHLSDGLPFHAGVDYAQSGLNMILNPPSWRQVTIFPAEYFTSYSGALGMYADITFTNLILCANGRFRMMCSNGQTAKYSGVNYPIRGSIEMCDSNGYNFETGDCSIYQIYSDIRGSGPIKVNMATEMTSDKTKLQASSIQNFNGRFELLGDNSAYTGKISVYSGGSFKSWFENMGHAAFAPSAVSNITLILHGPKTIGGAMSEFTADAIKLSDHSRIAFAENATFDAANRGICLMTNSYLCVTGDVVATVGETVTWGRATAVKEGSGSLFIATTPRYWGADNTSVTEREADPDEGDKLYNLNVAEGRVGTSGSGSLAGLNVYVEDGAGLVVTPTGGPVDLTTMNSFNCAAWKSEEEEAALDVAVDMGDEETYAVKYTVNLLKVSSDYKQTKKHVTATLQRAPKGYHLGSVAWVAGDDCQYIQVEVYRKPTTILVK